jgi:hypothetical protein
MNQQCNVTHSKYVTVTCIILANTKIMMRLLRRRFADYELSWTETYQDVPSPVPPSLSYGLSWREIRSDSQDLRQELSSSPPVYTPSPAASNTCPSWRRFACRSDLHFNGDFDVMVGNVCHIDFAGMELFFFDSAGVVAVVVAV